MRDEHFCTLPGGHRLCYTDTAPSPGTGPGPGPGEPLLLVIGLGLQLIHWPDTLLDALARRGFRVITFDNRDTGRSFRTDAQPPTPWQLLRGRLPAHGYTLEDMTADAVGLLDHLKIERVHVAGMSMGGMIAQLLAARYPARVKSLTSIFSTTGAAKVGQPGLRMLLRLSKRPARTPAQYVAKILGDLAIIGGRGFPVDRAAWRQLSERAWARDGADVARGMGRQLAAILRSGDRTAQVAGIRAPTLVVHGDRDPLVHPSGGVATARAIPGARHVVIPGMGHDVHPDLGERLAELIAENAQVGLGTAAQPGVVHA